MPKIKFAPAEETVFTNIVASPDQAVGEGEDGEAAKKRGIFGGPQELELFEVLQEPNNVAAPHAHVEDEILYVLEGSLIFGTREYLAGSAVFIPAWTLYSFRTGTGGARFLNFRPRAAERRTIWKDDFLKERRSETT